ncbi:hypothetical protein PTSG_05033 [Salpingoeca rosetta]|uniref:beta-N-acetylhexosaminidase n=1 Tax=Salpingoeca rosetta (strain ATCC 50818 / BSB-021) TaxID=946362 RepID=F2U9B4_SALR5|nr:uncharacterized protein PTSG_05033 [Salpingoeca rosetta]EGD73317.1 hypothetical protein PTSG_05033 [Salpingoeca rosetta]|eukprot:XP_004994348.1 hypothetical protein PTSG_05033 [Salpingoeca rosetta]
MRREEEDSEGKYRKGGRRRYAYETLGDDDGAASPSFLRGWVKFAVFIPVVIFVFIALNYAGMHTTMNRPHMQTVAHLHPTTNASNRIASTLPPLPEEMQKGKGKDNNAQQQQQQQEGDNGGGDGDNASTPADDDDDPAQFEDADGHPTVLSCSSYIKTDKCRIPLEYFEPALPQNRVTPIPTKKLQSGLDQGVVDILNFKFKCQSMHESSHSTHMLIMHTFERMCLRFASLCSANDASQEEKTSSQRPKGKRSKKPAKKPTATKSKASAAKAPASMTNNNNNDNNNNNNHASGRARRDIGDDILGTGPSALGGNTKQAKKTMKVHGVASKKQDMETLVSTSFFTLRQMEVVVRDPDVELDVGVNEGYALVVPAASDTPITIFSETVWGMIHGMETFFQLIGRRRVDGAPAISGLPVLIEDEPQQPWRGLLLDTSRHFYPLPVIIRLIEGMAMNKLNVLHWHMTDDQSFPIVSQKYPQLAQKGAFPAAKTHSYTAAMMGYIAEYAHNRSVVVVPELDVPGHAASWGLGIPDLLSCDGGKSPLNPTSPKSFEVIRDLIAELAPIFPHPYFHVGGDEFDLNCWKRNPDIAAAMKAQSDPRGEAMRQQLVDAAFDALKEHGKTPIVWKDLVEGHPTKIPDNAIIQHWKCWGTEVCTLHDTLQKSDHASVQSTCAYLDFDREWPKFHQQTMLFPDKCGSVDQDVARAVVRGGEAAIWSERISPRNVFCRTFPRAVAYAERLWSFDVNTVPSQNQTDTFFPRMTNLHKPGLAHAAEAINMERLNQAHADERFMRVAWKMPHKLE